MKYRGSSSGLRDKGKPVRIAAVPGKVQTKHLPNTSLEHYFYTNLFGVIIFHSYLIISKQ